MFGIGTSELFVLVIAALFILGPERLPAAAVWLAHTIKQVREYATGAREQFKDVLGPEFDELREPLAELQRLRGFNPRSAITKHLLDGDDSLFAPLAMDGEVPDSASPGRPSASGQPMPDRAKPGLNPNRAEATLAVGERPPFDADAT